MRRREVNVDKVRDSFIKFIATRRRCSRAHTLPFGQYSVRMSTVGRGKSIQAPTKRTVFSWLTSRACLISHSSVDVISTWNMHTKQQAIYTLLRKSSPVGHRFHSISTAIFSNTIWRRYLLLRNFFDGHTFALVNSNSCEHMCWRQRCAAGNRRSCRAHAELLQREILWCASPSTAPINNDKEIITFFFLFQFWIVWLARNIALTSKFNFCKPILLPNKRPTSKSISSGRTRHDILFNSLFSFNCLCVCIKWEWISWNK